MELSHSPAITVRSVDVTAVLHQESYDVVVASTDGVVERRDSLVIGGTRVCHLRTHISPLIEYLQVNVKMKERWSHGKYCRTANRGYGGSSHLPPIRNIGIFVHLTLPVSFGRDIKSRWSLLSGVYARGSKRSHTGGKYVTCSGLTNSREGQL